MDFLAGYASDSDSDGEMAGPTRGRSDPKDQDEENILAALKDLQSFAAMVDPVSTLPSTSQPAAAPSMDSSRSQDSGAPATEDADDQQFLSFLKEIEAIPIPETDIQPPPPPSPPCTQTDSTPAPPPPPPPPTLDGPDSTLATLLDTGNAVHEIYNRLQNLSLLPSPTIDTKDLERRLLEFEVRIEDWENHGLETWYFLGADRSQAILLAEKQLHSKAVAPSDTTFIPAFGGIVGAMEKRVQELELQAAPFGWKAIWDAEEEAYGFEHLRTGTYSPVYPSLEQLLHLDPPAPPPPSTSSNHKRTKVVYNTSAWSAAAPPSTSSSNMVSSVAISPTTTTTAAPLLTHNPWTSQSISSHSPTNTTFDTPTNSKKKKRKLVEDLTPPSNDFADQHIHPSRRAVLGPSQSVASSSTSTSKTMPKKLASLLQKWNEKDKDTADDEEDEDEEEDYQDHEGAGAMSGANSQSLGGDWRGRRLHHK